MTEYRVDATPTGVQRTCLYLHDIIAVLNEPDITYFINGNGNIIAIVPVSGNFAFVANGTEYRIDTLAAATQQPLIYLHNVSKVEANADSVFFLDPSNDVIAIVPTPTNIAYVAI